MKLPTHTAKTSLWSPADVLEKAIFAETLIVTDSVSNIDIDQKEKARKRRSDKHISPCFYLQRHVETVDVSYEVNGGRGNPGHWMLQSLRTESVYIVSRTELVGRGWKSHSTSGPLGHKHFAIFFVALFGVSSMLENISINIIPNWSADSIVIACWSIIWRNRMGCTFVVCRVFRDFDHSKSKLVK